MIGIWEERISGIMDGWEVAVARRGIFRMMGYPSGGFNVYGMMGWEVGVSAIIGYQRMMWYL
jgi:hypothetical protein